MLPTLARTLLAASSVVLVTTTASASPMDRIELRAKGERLSEIEAAIRPARLFDIPSGRVVCGEILRIDRREPYRDSTLLVRARWRADTDSPWVFADELVELRFADLVSVDPEFENVLDFHLFLSSRDEVFPPLGGVSWAHAMDWALDSEGILGLAHGEEPEPFAGSEPGWLVNHLTGPDPFALTMEEIEIQTRAFVETPVRATAAGLGQSSVLLLLEGLVAAEDRSADVEELWQLTRGAANYLFGLQRVLRRGDASALPSDQADLDASRIERFSLEAIRNVADALGATRNLLPMREDAADREALLAAVVAHESESESGVDAVSAWTRMLDARSSVVWPDAMLTSPDRSRRAAWALRLVRECPALWAMEEDVANLRDDYSQDWPGTVVGGLLTAGGRRLHSNGTPLPNPRLRDALAMGPEAIEVEFLQPDGHRTPLQIGAQRTLARYLVQDRPAVELGHAFPEEAFKRRREVALGSFTDAFGGSDPGLREAVFYTLLEAGPKRILAKPDTLYLRALTIEHHLFPRPEQGSPGERALEDSVVALCLLAGLYGGGDSPSAARFHDALADAMNVVQTKGRGLLHNLGLELPSSTHPEYRSLLLARLPGFCAAMQAHVQGVSPEQGLASLRSVVQASLVVEEAR